MTHEPPREPTTPPAHPHARPPVPEGSAPQAPAPQPPAPQWAGGPAASAPQASAPDAPPAALPYHRLGHADPRHRWWKPLYELGIAVAAFLTFQLLLGLVGGFALIATDPGALDQLADIGPTGAPDGVMESPGIFALTWLSVITMLPAVILARLALGPRPLGLISSVIGRLRWSWMMTCVGLGLAVYGIGQGGLILLSLALGEPAPEPPVSGGTLAVMALLVLTLVPVQCAAEEYAFRGYLMQTIGRWLRHPAWAILLPAPLFMLGHLYDAWGQASVGAMAVVAGWLCVRTGGLEAAIGLHIGNNLPLMLLGITGLADPFAEEGSTALSFLIAVAFELTYAALAVRLFDRRGHQRTWTPPAPAYPAAASPAPGHPAPPVHPPHSYPPQSAQMMPRPAPERNPS